MVDTETATSRTARKLLIAGIVIMGGAWLMTVASSWLGALLSQASDFAPYAFVASFSSLSSLSSLAYPLGAAFIGASIVIRVLRPKVTRFHGSHTE